MLRLLFKTKNLSVVKKYLISQWTKIYQGGDTLTIKDFTFSKEVKIGGYSPDCSPPPGAIVAHHAGTLHSTVLYCIVLCRAVLFLTVLYCTLLYCSVLYCTILYYIILYFTVLNCTVLYCTVSCYVITFIFLSFFVFPSK